jgi:hypothetical protein
MECTKKLVESLGAAATLLVGLFIKDAIKTAADWKNVPKKYQKCKRETASYPNIDWETENGEMYYMRPLVFQALLWETLYLSQKADRFEALNPEEKELFRRFLDELVQLWELINGEEPNIQAGDKSAKEFLINWELPANETPTCARLLQTEWAKGLIGNGASVNRLYQIGKRSKWTEGERQLLSMVFGRSDAGRGAQQASQWTDEYTGGVEEIESESEDEEEEEGADEAMTDGVDLGQNSHGGGSALAREQADAQSLRGRAEQAEARAEQLHGAKKKMDEPLARAQAEAQSLRGRVEQAEARSEQLHEAKKAMEEALAKAQGDAQSLRDRLEAEGSLPEAALQVEGELQVSLVGLDAFSQGPLKCPRIDCAYSRVGQSGRGCIEQ